MKHTILTLLFAVYAVTCGCTTFQPVIQPTKPTTKDATIIKAALAKKYPPTGNNFLLAAPSHLPPEPPNIQPPALITTSTKFASACPYCSQVTISKTCSMSGGTATVQNWTISYKCPTCHMDFADYRTQPQPETRSIRLPIVGE